MATGLPKAWAVFIPVSVVKNGPPLPYASWKQPGAILRWLRVKGFDAEVFVNWTRSRAEPAKCHLGPPYAPEHGYWLYYYGAEPTRQAISRIRR